MMVSTMISGWWVSGLEMNLGSGAARVAPHRAIAMPIASRTARSFDWPPVRVGVRVRLPCEMER